MIVKRIFDVVVAVSVLCFLSIPLLFFWMLATYDTRSNGLFTQIRIGQYGCPFVIYKLKTIHPASRKCSAIGGWMRKCKIDEWPQLFNVLKGDMSMVGPRPDIPGYYDLLQGEDRKILELKPGITSEASLKYRNEEMLLASKLDSLMYNDTVIFPDKIRMNMEYYKTRTLINDLWILGKTILSVVRLS